MENPLDQLPFEILLMVLRRCAKHDYVALYLAYPKLSRRLYTVIPQGLSICFTRLREEYSEFVSEYGFTLMSPYLKTNDSWNGYIYYKKERNRIALRANPEYITDNIGIDIEIPYDAQLYIHLKKSRRSFIGKLDGDCTICYDDSCPDCIKAIDGWEREVRYYTYGSDIED